MKVPAGLLASLDAAGGRARLAVLVRHAERFEIPAGQDGREVALTEAGRAQARRLGERLSPWKARWAEVSPLPRCVDTAAEAGLHGATNHLLGAPGPYVVDRVAGGQAFRTHGTEHVVRSLIGGTDWPFMRSVEGGARLLLADIRDRLEDRTGLGLFVSHDAIVMPVVAWATGEPFAEDWLSPLDGLVLEPTPTGLRAWWRGAETQVVL